MWYTAIYKAFVYVSIVLYALYVFLGSGTSTAFNALVTAFFMTSLGLMMIFILTVNQLRAISATFAMSSRQLGPLLLILGFLGYLLYLVLTFRDVIMSGHVSDTYYRFMNLAVCLLAVQLYMIMGKVNSDTGVLAMSSITAGLLYLLDLLTGVCLIIVSNVLQYFTTDGFATMPERI